MSEGAPGASPPHQQRWFRILALLSPLVLLCAVEIVLRLAGYGYPTQFLHIAPDRKVWVENQKFGWRFFPPTVARSPQPLLLERKKSEGLLRIIVFGESAAMGDPEPAYGLARQLETILQASQPDRKVEVINAGMTAINSQVIREIARDCRQLEADFWIIYAGNNEVIGPYGAGTVFGRQAPALATVRLSLAVKRLRLGQLLAGLAGGAEGPREWEGMELFLKNQVPSGDLRLARVYANFAANLRDIIGLGLRSGAKVLVSTMVVNLKDSPPFGSQHRSGLSPEELSSWEKLFTRGCREQTNGRCVDAIAAYAQAALIDDRFAELQFRRAQCELALGRSDAACKSFQFARDLDTFRFRADTHLNQMTRSVAHSEGATLVDAEQECARLSAGAPGDDWFYDHVHLNFEGNYLVASLLAQAVQQRSATVSSRDRALPGDADVRGRLAFTEFDQRRVLEEMRLRLRQPPFSSQVNFVSREERLALAVSRLQTAPAASVASYRQAIGRAPHDWVLRANFGRLLSAAGDSPGAAAQWEEVCRLMPFEPDGWFQLGDLAYDRGALEEAADRFEHALRLNPACVEALNGLALAEVARGRTKQALQRFEQALTLRPRFSAARVNLAVLLARMGQIQAAMGQYRTTLRLDTNNVAARINLAKLLVAQQSYDEGIALYSEALRLQPDEPVAHYNLGNALTAKGRHAEALENYAAALQARPDWVEARLSLALELARQGKVDASLLHFAEVVRQQPDSIEGHFNYGVALARGQRYSEAVREFEVTLKLRPDHPNARPMLARASQLAARQPAGQ